MYPSVALAFNQENDKLEGIVRWPYPDNDNWITCAVGFKVDNGSGHAPPEMLALPWHVTTSNVSAEISAAPLATAAEVEDAWQAVKASGLAGIGGGKSEVAALTQIRLDDNGIQQATNGWIANAEPHLRASFPSYDIMFADPQLAILLMAYALGSAFSKEYPKFTAAINAVVPDYNVAADKSNISTVNNPGVLPRDEDIKVMLQNGARAQAAGNVPANVLWWPNTSPPDGSGTSGPMTATGGTFGKVLLGGVLGLFAWTGWLGYTHRNEVNAYTRKLLK